jgi:hypothetical protein
MNGETDGDQLEAMRHLCDALGHLLRDEQIAAQTRIDQTAELLARALATETADDIEAVVADVYRHAG